MPASNLFYFKRFVIDQTHCAMKVGADSMLVGALVPVNNVQNILDIGSGSGILSLMLAQRSNAKIQAIEIEEHAYRTSLKNALNSCWKSRIEIYHKSLQEFSPEGNLNFDLIISNPPYFPSANSIKSTSPKTDRSTARDQSKLSFEDLVFHASRLLNSNGKFYVILPFNEKDNFINIAKNNNLFPVEIIQIRSRKGSDFIRVILGFSADENIDAKISDFTIYENGNFYTEEYLMATKDFHAKNMRKK